MFLLIKPNGSKLWRLKYRVAGREKLFALGIYPNKSLKDARNARDARDDARRLIFSGIDPADQRKNITSANENTFEVVANEFVEQQSQQLSKITPSKIKWILREFLFPAVGKKPTHETKTSDILKPVRRLESEDKLETARRARALAGRIFRYTVATGRAERDPTIKVAIQSQQSGQQYR